MREMSSPIWMASITTANAIKSMFCERTEKRPRQRRVPALCAKGLVGARRNRTGARRCDLKRVSS